MIMQPIKRMFERIETDQSDSDVALFSSLMYCGEMIAKLVVAGLVGAVADDKARARYGLLYRLVRADGVGDWASSLGGCC